VVIVSLDEASYNVSEEDGFVSGCVVLKGFIERNVVVNLFTEDDTATGIYRVLTVPDGLKLNHYLLLEPEDYLAVSVPVIFSPDGLRSRMLCGNITILDDTVLENTEIFNVILNTSDTSVEFVQQSSPVNIEDNDGMKAHISQYKLWYIAKEFFVNSG